MEYVNNEYSGLASEWKEPAVGLWKAMWQYFFSFLMAFKAEMEAQWIDMFNQKEVADFFEQHQRLPVIDYLWWGYTYWGKFSDNEWNIQWTDELITKCFFR